jgi:transposase
VIEAVMGMRLTTLAANPRGTGSAQYPPKAMLALLIYCYANGVFSSRRIERATHTLVPVRYLMAGHHPDHDTICKFRRENLDAVREAFTQVLALAKTMGLLKVGAVSVDGTHILANAGKDRNVRYDRAGELEAELTAEIDRLLAEAERADREPDDAGAGAGGQRLPEPLARLEAMREGMRRARARLEEEAAQEARAARPAYEAKVRERERERRGGHPPPPPRETPRDQEQTNLTDPDSRLMRKTRRSGYEQVYNAQAAVDARGSMLILAARVSQCASDAHELAAAVEAVEAGVGRPTAALADGGYVNAEAFEKLEGEGLDLYVAVGRGDGQAERRFDYRPKSVTDKPPRTITDPRLLKMREKLKTEAGRAMYGLRKQTVEPVFGIIKGALGFRRFLLRGLEKVTGEWSLVSLAYNLKRLGTMRAAAA